MMKLVEQLTKIDPCYGIWLTAMHLSLQYLEGLSLHHQSFNIRAKYFEPLEDPDQLQMEIPISLVPLILTQGSAPQLIDAFTKVQESNMEKWLKLNKNKPLYDEIMKKLAPFFSAPLLLLAHFHWVMPCKYRWSFQPAALNSRQRSKSRRLLLLPSSSWVTLMKQAAPSS
jgi:hypothetical protein